VCFAALIAVSPFHVAYSQQAREYSLWTLLILISSALLLRGLRTGKLFLFVLHGVTVSLGLWSFTLFALVDNFTRHLYLFAALHEVHTPRVSSLRLRSSQALQRSLPGSKSYSREPASSQATRLGAQLLFRLRFSSASCFSMHRRCFRSRLSQPVLFAGFTGSARYRTFALPLPHIRGATFMAGSHQDDVAFFDRYVLLLERALELGASDAFAFAQRINALRACCIDQDATRNDRRNARCVGMQRAVIAEIARCVKAIEPMLIGSNRGVRERVDMRASVDGRHHQVAVEAVPDAVGLPQVERRGVVRCDDAHRRTISKNRERRMPVPQRHPHEAAAIKVVHAAALR
jgi:hypothetical protein